MLVVQGVEVGTKMKQKRKRRAKAVTAWAFVLRNGFIDPYCLYAKRSNMPLKRSGERIARVKISEV